MHCGAANRLAMRQFPIYAFLVYVSYIKLVVGETECANLSITTFWVVTTAIVGTTLLLECVAHARGNAGTGVLGIVRGFTDAVISAALLLGVILANGGPARCGFHSYHQSGAIGLALTYVVLGVTYARACISVRNASGEGIAAYVEMSEVGALDEESGAPLGFHYTELLWRAIALDMRRKFPTTHFIFHLTAVYVIAGTRPCSGVKLNGFVAYLVLALVCKFVISLVGTSSIQVLESRAERWIANTFEAIQTTGLLMALMLIVNHPLECIAKTGIPLVYHVSYGFLCLFLVLSLVSSYLTMRTFSGTQLQRVVRGVVPRKHQ